MSSIVDLAKKTFLDPFQLPPPIVTYHLADVYGTTQPYFFLYVGLRQQLPWLYLSLKLL